MNRKPLLILLSIIVAGLAAGCILKYSRQSHAREYSRQLFAMDTVMSFTAYGERGEEAVEAAVQEVERLDALLSTGIAESEVSRINVSGEGDLSEDTEKILSEGLTIWKQTGGLFDVTIYPLMQLWGFPTGNYHVPTKEELKQTTSLVDSSKVILDGNHVTLGEKQKMDLGGIAKGYTSNRIMEIFQEYGVTSAMVSLGGNVQTLGKKPDGTDWQVGIQNPDNVQGDLLGAVAVQDQAVITSGGYERYFEENGQTYIHILDPRTGCPAESGLASVTIVSSNGMLADALSTSLYIMGLDEAEAYWRIYADEFDMILMTDDGTVYVTEGIRDRFRTKGKMEVLYREEP